MKILGNSKLYALHQASCKKPFPPQGVAGCPRVAAICIPPHTSGCTHTTFFEANLTFQQLLLSHVPFPSSLNDFSSCSLP